ncbi:Ankyrin repeat-containing domain [Macleaya cordata]|uniref:Ankyrin repeat-containing domain n=1 Tax=Macleaya cordata TaxID=56857 RepID=A0A200PZ44_MACCD|nr:Ankyrin repeat-containing domain [Macleaya cordata]
MHFHAVSRKRVGDDHTIDTENPRQVQRKSASCTSGAGRCWSEKDEQLQVKNEGLGSNGSLAPPHHQLYPPNYTTCFNFFQLTMKALLVVLGLGFTRVRKIKEKKEKHTWAVQIMEELVERVFAWEYDSNGGDPQKPHIEGETKAFDALRQQQQQPPPPTPSDAEVPSKKDKKRKGIAETPILIAAKTGVTEMVEKILDKFPMAIQDINSERKNVALLAVENRQPHVYQLLLKRKILLESVFRKLDSKGNSALHLAATLGQYRPWLIPGAALQMQWEIRWYKFVKESMPRNFFVRLNDEGKTPKQVFTETHKGLVEEGGKWLTNTSESCSVVAALIATVAFATAATVPGGVKSETGAPTLEKEPAFSAFAISSLVALCFSVTSVIMFLSILTSRYQEQDFGSDLPRKLIVGLSSLFISIASMLVSFCAGHFFVLKDKLRYAAYPLYATTCLPVAFFAAAQFPLYFDLIRATFKKVPQRSYKVNVAI